MKLLKGHNPQITHENFSELYALEDYAGADPVVSYLIRYVIFRPEVDS